MSKVTLIPANNHVIVVDILEGSSIGGISLPDNIRQKDMILGLVAFVGPQCAETRVQDKVYYGPYAGKLITIQGTEFRILSEGQIEVYVRTSSSEEESNG